MYELNQAEYLRANPWDISFEARLSKLIKAHNNGFKNVAYLYEQADTSTFRYRVYNMCQSLDESDIWTGTYFYETELEELKRHITEIDLIIIARFKWTFELQEFVRLVKRQGIKVGFDVDDLVYDPKYLPLVTNTLAVEFKDMWDYKYWFEYIGRVEATSKLCDFAVTTNDYIATQIKEDLKVESYVVPNFFNREQDIEAANCRAQKERYEGINKGFYIGYFSGTPSHINDFLTVAPELRDLLYKYDDMYLRLVGFMELPEYMKELKDVGKIEVIPLQNFIDLQTKIAEVDVNIVPLVNNHFTNCKSELKYFEASIVNTVTCATPTYVYKENIEHGVNGYLCNPGEWYSTIEKLYLNGIPENVVKNAYDKCSTKYAYYNQRIIIENALENIAG